MSKIQEIVNQLRKIYPDLEIVVLIKDNRGTLIVNTKKIFRFEPDYIEKQLNKFGEDGFNETVKIWAEYIQTRYIQRKNRFDKKQGGRPGLALTASQIKFAMNNTKSNSAAARFLNVAFNTYAKYAKMHGLFEQHRNPSGKGIVKRGNKQKVPLEDIFANKHPNYDLRSLKKRLIEEMILEEKCHVCGYQERRAFDGKIGLVLDFIDGNPKNMTRENIRLICFNCRFNIRGRLSTHTLRMLDKEYNENLLNEEEEKVKNIWNELNQKKEEKEKYEPSIIQTNADDIDNVWKKFNP